MTSTEVALREAVDGTVAQLRDPGFEQQVALAVPEGVSPRKLLRVAATAVLENPELARPDLRPSLLQATLKAAADGLVPDGRHAAFVIFGGKNPSVAYMPMYLGLVAIAAEHGISLFATTVHEHDAFEPDALDAPNPRANHKPPRLGIDRGPVIGAYAVAQHKDGRRWLEIMDKAEIEKIRNVSRAKDSGPWVTWYEQMAAIRPARRLFKRLPLDPKDAERIERVLRATEVENGNEIEVLYGSQDQQAASGTGTVPGEAEAEPDPSQAAEPTATPQPSASAEVPFEGEEPPPVSEELEAASEPTFSTGRYSGKTIAEVYASGKDGLSYCRWAFAAWKTQPLRGALDRFAEEHPDVAA